jgi:hypothetical protein
MGPTICSGRNLPGSFRVVRTRPAPPPVVAAETIHLKLILPLHRHEHPRFRRMEVNVPRPKPVAGTWRDGGNIAQLPILQRLYRQRSGIFDLRGGSVVAAGNQHQRAVRRHHADLVREEATIDRRGPLDLLANRAVQAKWMDRHGAGDVVCGEQPLSRSVNADVDRTRTDQHWRAERAEFCCRLVDRQGGETVRAIGFAHRDELLEEAYRIGFVGWRHAYWINAGGVKLPCRVSSALPISPCQQVKLGPKAS